LVKFLCPEMRPDSRLVRRLGVLALAFLAATFVAAGSSSAGSGRIVGESPGSWCGGALWRQMALSDSRRARIDFRPVRTSIAQVSTLVPPRTIRTTRLTPFQLRSWSMPAVVDRYRIASNGEIVLILYSIQSAQYMDAYLPNPHCLGPRSRGRPAMIAARKEFTSHCPPATAQWQLLGATVELTGVGFWNPSKATRGALPNGAELRPLTNVKIVNGCGSP
jgi:hypothetical protein